MTTGRASLPKAAERQFSLVLALVATKHGLTKQDVLSSVHGYRQEFDRTGATESLDRKFERDKQDLRELGITIETLDDPAAPGDNQLTRYRIRESSLHMAPQIQLDPDESALVSLAAAVWREGALAGESRRGLMKLRARGAEVRAGLPDIAPRMRGRAPVFEQLTEAIEHGHAVTFAYTKQRAEHPERRRVEPLALVRFGGHWLLVAYDLDRDAERRFLLERISGTIGRAGAADPDRLAARRQRDYARESLEALRELAAAQPVIVDIAVGSDAELRLLRHAVATDRLQADALQADGLQADEQADRHGESAGESAGARAGAGASPARPTHVRATLQSADHELLADELAGFGPELVVREPDALRRDVRARLERVLADHAGAGETGR